jgi:hypothetical protein
MTPPDGPMDSSVFPPFIPGGYTPRSEPAPDPQPEGGPEDIAPSAAPADPFAAEAEAPAAATAESDAPGTEDLPWLELPPGSHITDDEDGDEGVRAYGDVTDAPAAEFSGEFATESPDEAAAAAERAIESDGGAFPDWLAWDTRDSDQAAAEVATAPPAAWADDLIVGDDLMEMEYAATAVDEGDDEDPPQPLDSADDWAADESAPAPSARVDAALADALAGVAERLERLAGTLRERPGELLSGGSTDPLDLLVAGYALGLAQGRARSPDG